MPCPCATGPLHPLAYEGILTVTITTPGLRTITLIVHGPLGGTTTWTDAVLLPRVLPRRPH